MNSEINNMQDIIDSRDVIARMDELRDGIEEDTGKDAGDFGSVGDWLIAAENSGACDPDTLEEYRMLDALADEASDYAPDWEYGEALIRDTYFKEYAQELAEDCGMVPDDSAHWPARCIDWDHAARELQMDYTAVDFDGVTYWIR